MVYIMDIVRDRTAWTAGKCAALNTVEQRYAAMVQTAQTHVSNAALAYAACCCACSSNDLDRVLIQFDLVAAEAERVMSDFAVVECELQAVLKLWQ